MTVWLSLQNTQPTLYPMPSVRAGQRVLGMKVWVLKKKIEKRNSSALCLPTFSHLLIVSKMSLSLQPWTLFLTLYKSNLARCPPPRPHFMPPASTSLHAEKGGPGLLKKVCRS
jgi:hypothetical protein